MIRMLGLAGELWGGEMGRFLSLSLIVLLHGFIFLSRSHGARDRLALVIGNGAYANAAQLPNPPNDATDVAQALRGIGFEVIEGKNLDKRAMEEKIVEFGHRLDGVALALFFYAGHGIQVNGHNYLVPTDARLQRAGDLSFETIDVNQVMAQMEVERRVNLIFLDACRDNPLARSFARSLGQSRSAMVGQGLASIQSSVGTMIAYATQPDNTALDGAGRNSPFTAALLKHIATPGIEVRTMMTRVRADVLSATNDKQVPWDHSSLIGDVVLAPAILPASKAAGIPSVTSGSPGISPPLAAATAPVASAKPQQPMPSPKSQEADEAERAWTAVKDTTSRAVLQAFVKRYPHTIYGELGSARLKELGQSSKPQDKVAAVIQPQLRGSGPTVFENPMINGIRVDKCMRWGPSGCNETAANHWCHSKGFAKATEWDSESIRPTIFQDSQSEVKVCDYFFCAGFSRIICE